MASIEQEIGDLLRQKGLTLGVVESATGGLISHRVTNAPGSSDYYIGSVTVYSNQAKIKIVGVKEDTLNKYGSVSPQVAEEMAQGGRKVLGADICLADTGIAGPSGGTPGKPVGLFYLGLAHKDSTRSQKHEFQGSREQNKQAAAEAADGAVDRQAVTVQVGAERLVVQRDTADAGAEADGLGDLGHRRPPRPPERARRCPRRRGRRTNPTCRRSSCGERWGRRPA